MTKGWRQTWSDFLDSFRGSPPSIDSDALSAEQETGLEVSRSGSESTKLHVDEPRHVRIEENAPIGVDIGSKVAQIESAQDPDQPRKLSGRSYAVIGLITAIATVPWLLSSFHFGADLFAPDPPAPDVVATFDGGRITIGDVEAHLNLLVPSQSRKYSRSANALFTIVEDLISDQLVLRWASDRKPEGDEAFQHAIKHINEELSIDAFANQLHKDVVPIAESQLRNYYEANVSRLGSRSFTESREEIRQTLITKSEPEFFKRYLARLRTNASIARNFDLLEIPRPSEEELDLYYRENLNKFAIPRRAIVDEIEVPKSTFGDTTRRRASDLLLRIRGGISFEEAANRIPGVQLSNNREVPEGARSLDWDEIVFALVPDKQGSVFQAGDSFYVIRLKEIKPARTQTLSEVRSVVSAAVERKKEREWFAENGEKTLFTVKGQRFSLKQFYKEYRELPEFQRDRYVGTGGLKKLADALIDRMLLVADTYDKLLDVKTKPLADETRLRLLRKMMEQEEVDDKIVVTEAEMQEYYAGNSERLAYPPKARIRYIRIGLGSSEDEERRAWERADEAYAKLVPGFFREGADFASVARDYSEDPESAAKGGERNGWIGEGSDPLREVLDHPFHQVVLSLDIGEISQPFNVLQSLYIVQVLERTEPKALSFGEAEPYIEEILTEQKHRSLAVGLEKRLLEKANVEIYPGVLEDYIERRSQPNDKTP